MGVNFRENPIVRQFKILWFSFCVLPRQMILDHAPYSLCICQSALHFLVSLLYGRRTNQTKQSSRWPWKDVFCCCEIMIESHGRNVLLCTWRVSFRGRGGGICPPWILSAPPSWDLKRIHWSKLMPPLSYSQNSTLPFLARMSGWNTDVKKAVEAPHVKILASSEVCGFYFCVYIMGAKNTDLHHAKISRYMLLFNASIVLNK